MNIKVEIEKTRDGFGLEAHGNWCDIIMPEQTILKKDKYVEIPLGFKTNIPDGYEGHLLPRSSSFRKYGIICANQMGIVDSDYNNEWFAFVLPTKDAVIPKGSRVFQFTICKTMYPDYVFSKLSRKSDRGMSGSSGC